MKTKFAQALIVIVFVISCRAKTECPPFYGYLPPHTFYIKLLQNGKRLSDYTLDNLRLVYYKNGDKKYVYDFLRAINEGGISAKDSGWMTTREVGIISGDSKIKDFYMEFPDGDIDTFYIDYKRLSACEASVHPCNCLYPFIEASYNGNKLFVDPNFKLVDLYVANKK